LARREEISPLHQAVALHAKRSPGTTAATSGGRLCWNAKRNFSEGGVDSIVLWQGNRQFVSCREAILLRIDAIHDNRRHDAAEATRLTLKSNVFQCIDGGTARALRARTAHRPCPKPFVVFTPLRCVPALYWNVLLNGEAGAVRPRHGTDHAADSRRR
jgi:hypothetical protein